MRRAALIVIAFCSCSSTSLLGRAHVISNDTDARPISIVVSRDAFTPDRIVARVGERIRLRFTRTTTSRCAREVIIGLNSATIRRELPRGRTTEISVELDRVGEIGFSCSMHMLGGVIVVEP